MSKPSPRHSLPARLGLWVGPALALPLWAGPKLGWWPLPDGSLVGSMAALTVLMAVWWMTEAVPIAATALLPLVLFPLLGIPPGGGVTAEYAHPMIFLFLGGFLLALAIEDSGLHRRLALSILVAVGDNPRHVVLGFMLATALLSMWLSNTATTMMIFPIAVSVLAQAQSSSHDVQRIGRFNVALLLGVAYAANIGGMATLIGTPPNASFKAIFGEMFPGEPEVSFFGWMTVALPFAVAMLVAAWALLCLVLYRVGNQPFLGESNVVRRELRELGPMDRCQWSMLVLFLITAALWILREPVRGWGWAPRLGVDRLADGTVLVGDGTVAIAMALVCFILPSGRAPGERLLKWEAAVRVPWGILLLFGGGLALAQGMQTTGLDTYVGRHLADSLDGLSPVGMIALTATGMTFFTELTSNLASVNMLLPVLGSTAVELELNPRLLMIPATLAASCAFMLPVATPPNAIVYGSGLLRMRDMIRAGLILNLVGVIFVVAFILLLGAHV